MTAADERATAFAEPLAGIRVLDLTRALAGPFCTLVLAGLGAEVIKLEDPDGGDIARNNAPYLGPGGLRLQRSSGGDLSLAVLNRCRGKQSVTLNLKHAEAPGIFADLVARCDVVVENFSSGTADRLGVGYAAARAANPGIVYCSITGFGAGLETGVRAMDAVIQALSGVMMTSGSADDPPIRVGVPMADALTPLWAVIGILAALEQRRRTGAGHHVDVSMLGALSSLVATEDWDALGELGQPRRTGPTLPRLAPFGLYRCADGWVAIVAPQQKLAADLFAAMGRGELLEDPRFSSRDARVANEAALTVEIEAYTSTRRVEEVSDTLAAHGVPSAPVRDPVEAIRDPRVVGRAETVPVIHPELGVDDRYRTAGIAITFSGTPAGTSAPAPLLGAQTDEVLSQLLGYDEEHRAALRSSGAI